MPKIKTLNKFQFCPFCKLNVPMKRYLQHFFGQHKTEEWEQHKSHVIKDSQMMLRNITITDS